MHLLDKRSTRALPVALMIHDNSTDRTAIVPATHHSNFCPINFRWIGVMINRDSPGHSYFIIIAIVGLQRGIPSKHESSARVDYDPALCTHRPSLLPIEWSGEVFGSRRRGRTTRERVIKHQREGVWSLHCAPSPPCPGDTGTRVPVAKRTTSGVNYAKESE
ncbi:hypothetical protein V6N13_116759 [Hibiscus sabdariffa]